MFAEQIARRITEAEMLGVDSVKVSAGEVHRAGGGYPAVNHRMPLCCDAMCREQRDGDRVVSAPPKGTRARLLPSETCYLDSLWRR